MEVHIHRPHKSLVTTPSVSFRELTQVKLFSFKNEANSFPFLFCSLISPLISTGPSHAFRSPCNTNPIPDV